MKSFLKIFLVVCLILQLSPVVSGNSINFGPFTLEQDTTDLSNRIRVDTFRLAIIPPSSGVQFFRDKIMFLSLVKNELKMSADHISFGSVEAYYATVMDSLTGKHYLFSPFIPFSFPAEAVTFNRSCDTIYFTKLADNNKEEIYMARYAMDDKSEPGLAGEIKSMDFCSGNFNYSHPALSADGNTMIFASDREGTAGGMDLFISRRVHMKWSSPGNLGNLINTKKDEFFPFLDSDNNLFFSSDGLKGYGGFDIFRSKFNGKGWDKPVNLSFGINSKDDDIAFTVNAIDKQTGFFTRKTAKGEMQLFMIRVNQDYKNLIAAFDGTKEPKALTAAVSEKETKPPEVEPVIAVPAKPAEKPVEKTPEKPYQKPVEKIAEKIPEKEPVKEPVKNPPVIQPKTASKPKPEADSSIVTIKTSLPIPANQRDVIIFRVQILTSDKPKKEKEITLDGKKYKLYEYFYKGAYRYCIGEFTSLKPALEIKKAGRESIFPEAFVAVFKNNKRTLNLVNSFK